MTRFGRIVCALIACMCMTATVAWGGYKMQVDENTKGEIGFWTQAWYQWVEDGKSGGTEDLNDFEIRRAYLYLKGQVTDNLSFFTHIASDRVGQEGLDKPSVGLGSGVAWRDLWITLKLNEALKIQAGRMYVPLTRNYGTTSTKALLALDLSPLQGGVRGSIFYASKVGRDDGVTIWGNPFDGKLQYRFMVSEGVEGADNPDDNLRFVGRISVNLMDPETGWFNKGTYLGKKKVLAIGAGYDYQDDLDLGGPKLEENDVWTVDLFVDQPVGEGAVTLEAAYIDINSSTQSHAFSKTGLSKGDDAEDWYVLLGYLCPGKVGPGQIQPYVRYENIDVDKKDDTDFWAAGLNYYLKGHNGKISADYTYVDPDAKGMDEQSIVTVQIAVGF